MGLLVSAVLVLSSTAAWRSSTLGEEVESAREGVLVNCLVAVTSINTILCIEHLGESQMNVFFSYNALCWFFCGRVQIFFSFFIGMTFFTTVISLINNDPRLIITIITENQYDCTMFDVRLYSSFLHQACFFTMSSLHLSALKLYKYCYHLSYCSLWIILVSIQTTCK